MKVPSSSLSPELIKANQRLYELRQQAQSHKAEPSPIEEGIPSPTIPPWEDLHSPKDAQTIFDPVSKLPPHLGWDSFAATQAARSATRRREKNGSQFERLTVDHIPIRPIPNMRNQNNQLIDFQSPPGVVYQLRVPLQGDTVRHYPSIGVGALKTEQASFYRVWLMCRYLDEPGRGWLLIQDVREQLTDNESSLRLFGWRRLRQVLGRGHGRFWKWDKGNGRVWLFGAARVAANLEVIRLTGKPVLLPVTAVIKIGAFKAHLYAAWHSGRKATNPISRQVQKSITGITERTQRHYCCVAKIRRQANIAIGRKSTPEEVEKQSWHRGRAIFQFTDHQGQHGCKGCKYVAWHLPNSYIGPHQQTANGRIRKINQKLSDLVKIGTQGNEQKEVEKLYHANGSKATQALNRCVNIDIYWSSNVESSSCQNWYVLKKA